MINQFWWYFLFFGIWLIDGTSYIYLPEFAACTIMVPDICDKSDGTVLMEGISMCSVTTLRFSCSPWAMRLDISADSSSTKLNGIPRTVTGDVIEGCWTEFSRKWRQSIQQIVIKWFFDINYFSYDTLLMYLPLVLDGGFVVTETCIVDLTLLVSSRRFSGEDLSFKCSG